MLPATTREAARRFADATAYVAPDGWALSYRDLDRVSAEDILTLMDRFNAELGKTIIMVTHDPNAARRARIAPWCV